MRNYIFFTAGIIIVDLILFLLFNGCLGVKRLDCGTVNVYPVEASGVEMLIIGGKDAEPLMFPWVGYLAGTDPKDTRCTITLIAPRLAITAAHCVNKQCWQKVLAVFGIVDIKDLQPKNVFEISRFYYPKSFRVFRNEKNEEDALDDVALLELTKSVNFSEFNGAVKTICLPNPKQSIEGAELFLMGWGMSNLTTKTTKLQYMLATALPEKDCQDKTKFCTKGRKDKQTPFKGDSGSPAVKLSNGIYSLHGVLSAGNTIISYYTTIKDQLEWIRHRPTENTFYPNCTKEGYLIKPTT